MIILDANVLIGYLDSADEHHEASKTLVANRLFDGFASSVLTVAEALVQPSQANQEDATLAAIHALGVEILPIGAFDASSLARIRGVYRLRMPDAVALYAAMKTRSELASFDINLNRAARRAGVTLAI